MRRIVVLALSLAMLLSLAVPASAGGDHHRKRHRDRGPDVVDVVLKVSGDEGFDRNESDYDILREALVKADLVDALKDARRITVWAPNDRAFKKLARDLGFRRWRSERRAFKYLKRELRDIDKDLLKDVLLYHVSPRELDARRVIRRAERKGKIRTLNGEKIKPRLRHGSIVLRDKDPDLRNPRIIEPFNIRAKNGIIHTIDRVLIPADL